MGSQRLRRTLGFGVAGSIAVWFSACATSSWQREVDRGDFVHLGQQVAGAEERGAVSNEEARSLARSVGAQALLSAAAADRLARVREARACAKELDAPLTRVMEGVDRAASEAAMARLESGAWSFGRARDYVQSADDGWRAVGARALVRGDDCAARTKALLDAAPAVRRAAAHASRASSARCADIEGTQRELTALLDAVRLDPDALVRTDAVRALPALLERDGDPDHATLVVRALGDAWEEADEPTRDEVARAYAVPALYDRGGREHLTLLLADQGSSGGIEAAFAVLTLRAASSGASGPDLASSASAFFARAVREGSRRDKLHALALVGMGHPEAAVLQAVRDASRDPDADVSFGALARLTESAADRASAMAALEALAVPGAAPARASRARLALASAGDPRIQAWLEADLRSQKDSEGSSSAHWAPEDERKLDAARGLAALGRPERAAPLLADGDVSVRLRAACTILVSARLSR